MGKFLVLLGLSVSCFAQNPSTNFFDHVPHPYRIINGETNGVRGKDWVHFCGTVVQVLDNRILLHGYYSKPPLGSFFPDEQFDFVVMNYPFQVVDGELVSFRLCLMAKQAGVYQYQDVTGAMRTVRKLDYGKPCGPAVIKKTLN